uniref:Galaxin-like repeats domain-containing protein n=1 Tax=Globodera rostochiensis TaxID=31243 RepID=A0A914HUY8_GLORO
MRTHSIDASSSLQQYSRHFTAVTSPSDNIGPNFPTTAGYRNSFSNFAMPLVLRACCGDNCEEFQRPEEMYGITCCGDEPSNQFEEICCDNVPRRRRQPSSFIDRCCGNQTLAYDQTCCQGVVHNIPSGECCGRMAYPRNSFNTLCCEETLITNVDPTLTCCGKNAYDGGKREMCCGSSVYLKELFDGCCSLYGRNPPEYKQFSSRSHQCCDKPIEKFGPTKCCYLKDSQGRFFPKSYDSSSQCCAFPYTKITTKNANGTCAN